MIENIQKNQWEDYTRIEQALAYLETNQSRQPSLQEIAASVNLSEYHFQRLFTHWVGISPKRFLQFLTKEHAKELLAQSQDVLSAAHEAGLSGPGRLHDLLVTTEAVTPGDYKRAGQGLLIRYGFHPTPFGECILAVTDRGICGLEFVTPGKRLQAVQNLRERWQKAELQEDSRATAVYIDQIFNLAKRAGPGQLPVYLKGTNFQIKVWEALLQIPAGKVVSYEDLAAHVGRPRAARAVGTALAHNPVHFLIPCHRVIRKMGLFGDYADGTPRKMAILGWEFSQEQGIPA